MRILWTFCSRNDSQFLVSEGAVAFAERAYRTLAKILLGLLEVRHFRLVEVVGGSVLVSGVEE
jgi:hypothetical protein